MIVRIKGIARVWKTLASGERRVYLYAWRGGPLLTDENGEPLQLGDPRIVKAHADAVEQHRAKTADTLETLIDEFVASSDYKSKSAKTKRDYDRYLANIKRYQVNGRKLASMPIDAIQVPAARGLFKAWRDTMAEKPRTADYAWTTLARVLSVAKDRGRIAVNVCERGGRLYKADRAEKIWTKADISAFMAVASEPLKLALIMGLWTGQREGDLLRAPWSAYDGKTLRIRQRKTGARVSIPVGEPLRIAMDAAPRVATTIQTNTRKLSWTEDGFRTSWGKACGKAGVTHLTYHDLRGTAVTRLAMAGCSTSQIGAITGHSLKDVQTILDTHYLGGQIELAEIAIEKLERFAKSL
jgi:integrase